MADAERNFASLEDVGARELEGNGGGHALPPPSPTKTPTQNAEQTETQARIVHAVGDEMSTEVGEVGEVGEVVVGGRVWADQTIRCQVWPKERPNCLQPCGKGCFCMAARLCS